jgi:hypothetical protein
MGGTAVIIPIMLIPICPPNLYGRYLCGTIVGWYFYAQSWIMVKNSQPVCYGVVNRMIMLVANILEMLNGLGEIHSCLDPHTPAKKT